MRADGRSTNSLRPSDLLPSDTAGETVAISSIAIARLERAFSVLGAAKPGLPVSSAIVVSFANHLSVTLSSAMPARVRPDWGEAIDEERRFGGIWLTDG
jgi:hypothetical protein